MEKCLRIIRLSATLALSYLAGQRMRVPLRLHSHHASFDFAPDEVNHWWEVHSPPP
jgi:hypothetical protein